MQKLIPIDSHIQSANKTILPITNIDGDDGVAGTDDTCAESDPEFSTTIGKTNCSRRAILRLDPPKALPVGNFWRLIEFSSEDDNLE